MKVEKFYFDDEASFYTYVETELGLDLDNMSLDERESFIKEVALKGDTLHTSKGIYVSVGKYHTTEWMMIQDLNEDVLYLITEEREADEEII